MGRNATEKTILIDSDCQELDLTPSGNVPVSIAETSAVVHVSIDGVTVEDGALSVTKQDQFSEIVDLLLGVTVSNLTLTVPTNIDDITITCDVDIAFVPSVGEYVCLKEDFSFYQSEIITVTPNGGDNYTLEVEGPLDFAFTTAGGCSIMDPNMAVDGSVTPVIFEVTPAQMDPSVSWDITRTGWAFTGPSYGAPIQAPDDTGFGTQLAQTRGFTVRRVNGVYKNIFSVNNNAKLKLRCAGDLTYTTANRAGEYSASARRTFNGDDKNGVVVRLNNNAVEADADRYQVIVQANLTAHTSIYCNIQGHVVTP